MAPEDAPLQPDEEQLPEPTSDTKRSQELPAIIIGDSGAAQDRPLIRLLPGRLPASMLLYPAYTLVGIAALLTTHYSLRTGGWHPGMTLLGWGLLFCWYWVYGVAYRYRRWMMKSFALLMSIITAGSLSVVTAVRSRPMAIPVDGELVVGGAHPTLLIATALTTLSLTLIIAHISYLGRGYRQKRLDDDNKSSPQ